MKGDRDDPFTHDTGDKRRRWCKCRTCGVVTLCTPRFDFYIGRMGEPGTTGLPIECENCARERWAAAGADVSRLPAVEGPPS